MNRICIVTLMGALLGAAALNAQNPLSSDVKNSYNGIKGTITKAADEVSEADYSFKASPAGRSIYPPRPSGTISTRLILVVLISVILPSAWPR